MTHVTGTALRMRCQLANLAQKHGSPPLDSHPLPLTSPPPTTELPLLISGIAAATTIDAGRHRFAPNCFTWAKPLPPLLYRHDASRVAGRILSLSHDHSGQLVITAEVTDPVAAACSGLSVGATVIDWAMVDEHRPTYHAEIKSAVVGPATGERGLPHNQPPPALRAGEILRPAFARRERHREDGGGDRCRSGEGPALKIKRRTSTAACSSTTDRLRQTGEPDNHEGDVEP